MKALLTRYVDLSFRRPGRVMLAAAVVLGVSLWTAGHLDFRGSFLELLPQSTREVRDLEAVAQKAGGDGYLVIQVTGGDRDRRRAFANEAVPRLEALKEVRYVEYRYSVEFFKKRALWLLRTDQLRELRRDLGARIRYEKEQANPLLVDLTDDTPPPTFEEIEKKFGSDAPKSEYIESKAGDELYLLIKPDGFTGDLGFSARLLDRVDSALKSALGRFPGLRIDSTGVYKIRVEEDQIMKRDLVLSSTLSLVFAGLLILIATRRPVTFFSVGFPLLVGLAGAFAIAELVIGHLNVVTGFLVAILIGLGIEYGVHLSLRYFEERRQLGAEQAMEVAVQGTFSGALTSALTNSAAFLVLLFCGFEAFQQFGFIAGVGVLCTLLAAYAVAPATLAIAERLKPFRPAEHAPALETRLPDRAWPTWALVGIFVVVVSFAGYSISVLPQFSLESDMRKLKGDSPALRLEDHMTEALGMNVSPAVWAVKNLDDAERVEELVRASQKQMGEASAFQRVGSLNDFYPRDVASRRAEIEAIRPLLADLPDSVRNGEARDKIRDFEAMLDTPPFGPEDIPKDIHRRFDALGGQGTFVLVFPKYRQYDLHEIHTWTAQVDQVASLARSEGREVQILDGNLIASRVFNLVYADGPYILWSASLVVFVAIWASLRRLGKAVLVATPLFLGMTCLAGAMHLFNVKLNFINGAVLTNILAIAVDNSVHLYHRYEEEGPGSLGFVLRQTGFAAIIATLTNGAGYGALLLAHHGGLRSIGQLAVIGVTCTSIGTTVLFPALLALIERWRSRGRGDSLPKPQTSAA